MDSARTAKSNDPSTSSTETIVEETQTTTDASSTDSFSSYCSDCPICNPPDTKLGKIYAYGTIEPRSLGTQPPKPTFLEESVEAFAQICCCICDGPPPSIRTSEWSSTQYPSSSSSQSYSYGDTETTFSQDQTSDAETIHTQGQPRQDDGYKRQQGMRSTKDEAPAPHPHKSFQQSE
ncbi:hypothetical protein V8C42DRAFT_330707 [Trichoderma barbatum]